MAKNLLLAAAGGSSEKVYVEDVFSTYLYTGNGSTQTITNNIDLSGEGGLVWTKNRNSTQGHSVIDTVRGNTKYLLTQTTDGNQTSTDDITGFLSTGYTLGDNATTGNTNYSPLTYVSWTFRKAKKFFDVVTYTGSASTQNISHNLGSVPGCIIVKRISGVEDWFVYHTSLGNTKYLKLNTTAAEASGFAAWNNTSPTSTQFTVLGDRTEVNKAGSTYVAYLFAHDAGGFGDAGDQSIIKCGSWTGNTAVNLGYEPQWILIKRTDDTSNWFLLDVMRGWTAGGILNFLLPNSSVAESVDAQSYITINSTGFAPGSDSFFQTGTFIYVAIRRGPMKTPTSGTSVFTPVAYSGTGAAQDINTNILTDATFTKNRLSSSSVNNALTARLTGKVYLKTTSTEEEVSPGNAMLYDYNNKVRVQGSEARWNTSGTNNFVAWAFGRAPGFFDVVCYTGTGSARTVSHNLGVAPELMIVKRRSNADNWFVYSQTLGNTKHIALDGSGGASGNNIAYWNNTSPTSSVFTVGDDTAVNASGSTYVAYLFASLSGVSKIGTYTGNGSSVTVTTDFQPRFILVKRTDSTGNWIVGDSARGLVAGNDPYLLLNSTAVEDTDEDWVDITSTSFTVNETAANTNVNTGTYIYLAIA